MTQALYQALQLVYPWESVSEIQTIKEILHDACISCGQVLVYSTFKPAVIQNGAILTVRRST